MEAIVQEIAEEESTIYIYYFGATGNFDIMA